MTLHVDDTDIDQLLGATFAKVGPSPTVVEASRRLNAMLDAARGAQPDYIDPRTLSVRFTRLRALYLSGAHYLHAAQDRWEDSLALRMGSGFHASLFENRPVVCYDGTRSGKAWERFAEAARGRNAVVLSEREYGVCCGMVGAVRKHERAMDLLFDGTTTEKTLEWEIGGRKCRATPDAFRLGRPGTGEGGYIVELKTARSTEPRWFRREARNRHYHAQLAWYDLAIESFAGRRSAEAFIVAVENVAPYNVTVLRLADEVREIGDRLCRLWWEQLLVAEASEHYGPYVETDIAFDVDDIEREDDLVLNVGGEELTL